MGLGIRILMVAIVILVLVFDFYFLLLASGEEPECVTTLTSKGVTSLESAQDTCQDFMKMKQKRWIVLGVSGVIIAVCGIVFFVKRD